MSLHLIIILYQYKNNKYIYFYYTNAIRTFYPFMEEKLIKYAMKRQR